MPDRRPRADLLAGFVDGSLDDAGRDELLRQVQGDPRAVEQVRRQALIHGVLLASAGQPIDADVVMAKLATLVSPVEREVMGYVMTHPPRASRPSWTKALGWMVAAATAVYFLWVRPPVPVAIQAPAPALDDPAFIPSPVASAVVQPSQPRLFAVLATASAGVFVLGDGDPRPARAADPLRTGDGLITRAGDGRAAVLLADGSRIDLSPDTVLARVTAPGPDEAGGGRLFVARGVVHIVRSSPTSAGLLRVDTPLGSVSLVSARVRVQVGGDGMQVDVNAGRARFVPAGREPQDLTSGQYALSAGEGSLTRGARGARRALLLAGAKILGAADAIIRTRLETLNFAVTTATSATLDLTLAADSSLVVVSSTVFPQDIDPRVRDLPVPILTWEVGLYPVLGMTGRCEDDECGFHQTSPFTLDVKDPGHPLAAAQTGVIDLPWTDKIAWGSPNINAAWVATITGHPTRAGIFAYDRGAAMPGLVAPARRVGFFFYDFSAEAMSRTSVIWHLFERAVLWCLD